MRGVSCGKAGSFTSKQWDEDVELYYFNARWYDPETGRFITEDPIRDGTGWYSYVGNNPMGFVDPTGLMSKSESKSAAAASHAASNPGAGFGSGGGNTSSDKESRPDGGGAKHRGWAHQHGNVWKSLKGATLYGLGGRNWRTNIFGWNDSKDDAATSLKQNRYVALDPGDNGEAPGNSDSGGTTQTEDESQLGVPPPGAGGTGPLNIQDDTYSIPYQGRTWEEEAVGQTYKTTDIFEGFWLTDSNGYLYFIDTSEKGIMPLFGISLNLDIENEVLNPFRIWVSSRQGLTENEKKALGFGMIGVGVGGLIAIGRDIQKNPTDDLGITGAWKLMGKDQAAFGMIGSGIAVAATADLKHAIPVEVEGAKEFLERASE